MPNDALFVGIPFGYVNPVACCKLDALACVYDTHTDWYVLYDWHTVLLPALQCKNDVTFDIHKLGAFEILHPNIHPIFGIAKGI